MVPPSHWQILAEHDDRPQVCNETLLEIAPSETAVSGLTDLCRMATTTSRPERYGTVWGLF
jgi:hypothetical protein